MSNAKEFLKFLLDDFDRYIETIVPIGDRVCENESLWKEFKQSMNSASWALFLGTDALESNHFFDDPDDFELTGCANCELNENPEHRKPRLKRKDQNNKSVGKKGEVL